MSNTGWMSVRERLITLRTSPFRSEMEQMAVEPVNKAVLRLAEPRRALGDHVEHRLDVSQRATDNIEDLAGRGLVFESLGQLLRARLHLVEQAHVLDRDHRL